MPYRRRTIAETGGGILDLVPNGETVRIAIMCRFFFMRKSSLNFFCREFFSNDHSIKIRHTRRVQHLVREHHNRAFGTCVSCLHFACCVGGNQDGKVARRKEANRLGAKEDGLQAGVRVAHGARVLARKTGCLRTDMSVRSTHGFPGQCPGRVASGAVARHGTRRRVIFFFFW